MLADDLLEIIRTNSAIASQYYKAAGGDFPATPATCYPLPAVASERLGCWAGRAQAALPDAATLSADEFVIAKTGDAVKIQLAWRVKEGECLEAGAENSTVCHYILTSEL
jgi:type IV pilus assembly protein PilV